MTVIHNSRHIVIPAMPGLLVHAPRGTAAAANWWEVSGKTCVVAYQPIGAASYAASLSNLANPGTYDAAEGVAPSFATATGWTFAASAWLAIASLPYASLTWSILIRATGASNALCSFSAIGGSEARAVYFDTSNYLKVNIGASSSVNMQEVPVDAVYGAAGDTPYLNGSAQTAIAAAVAKTSARAAIGANWPGYGPYSKYTGTIQAVVIYSAVLSESEMATVSTAMAAL